MTLAVLKLVHERCVGHASAEALVLQLASICLRDRNTFDFRSNRHPRNIHRNSTFSWTSWSVSQPARVEVQDVRPDGVHLDEYWAGTTIVGSIAGQPIGDRGAYQLHHLRLCAGSYGLAAIRYGRAGTVKYGGDGKL